MTFCKDLAGTHADLTLMPPEACAIQPSAWNIFDWEIAAGVRPSQTPAAPTTAPPSRH